MTLLLCVCRAAFLAAVLLPCALEAQRLPQGRFAARGTVLALTEGRYALSGAGGRAMAAGDLRVLADTIELRDAEGPPPCREAGRYRWRLAGDSLAFTLLADPCQGRQGIAAQPWVRVRDALVLTGATVIDGTGAPARAGQTIVLRDGLIAAVYADGTQPLPGDAAVRDLAGAWVLPGLVDAHVHLATSPSTVDRRDRVERRLRNALYGGVVAVRDMAGDGRALASLARDAAVGDIAAPEIRWAAVTGGPDFFADPRVASSSRGVAAGAAPWARAITDQADLRQIVAEARGAGAGAIKLYAALGGPLAARITAEAHRQGLRVWSHAALFPARPSEVVAAGADVISHALYLPWEAAATLPAYGARAQVDSAVGPDHPALRRLFALMRERGVILDATLWVWRVDPAAGDTVTAARRLRQAAALTAAAHRAGVRIAAGTDGIGADSAGAMPNIHTELQLLVERAGLTPMEAIVAGTRHSAAAAGLQASHGTIAAGMAADLLVLRADPLADIRNTRQIAFVVRRGQVAQ